MACERGNIAFRARARVRFHRDVLHSSLLVHSSSSTRCCRLACAFTPFEPSASQLCSFPRARNE
eukprot:7342848-Pyramimonas_sp.AAC.1